MLGNLLDNAFKWAATRVRVGAETDGGRLRLSVDDDGPGLPLGERERVLQRGARVDETMPGSGLGLAIVRDIARLYGGDIALENSALGGLRAVLELPAAPGEHTPT
jgi:signal transduction histidine kinase